MAQSQLRTEWLKIATAGDTIDGRKIDEQDLIDCAETYDPSEYGALMNWEHYKWYNLGDVLELKTEKDAKGRTCLFAVLCPNKYALQMNSQGEGLYFSVELLPNFANTGRTYLKALAFTNNPASLGTQRAYFSEEGQKSHLFSSPIAIEGGQFHLAETGNNDDSNLLKKIRQLFHTNPAENNEGDSTMNEEQQNQFAAAVAVAVSEALTPVVTEIKESVSQFSAQAQGEAGDATKKAQEAEQNKGAESSGTDEYVSKAAHDELANNYKALKEEIEGLKTQAFNETDEGEEHGEGNNLGVVC